MNRDTSTTAHFERFLAATGAAVCLVAATRIWQVLYASGSGSVGADANRLPGFYVLEMLLLSAAGLIGVIRDWAKVSWAVAGAYLGFAAMGAWTIGLAFLPTALLFAWAAMLATRRLRRNLIAYLITCLGAGAIQIGLMLLLIRLITPSAIF